MKRLVLVLLIVNVVCPAAIENLAVTSGATFEPGLPPKGGIATIFCTGLAGINGIIAASTLPLPRELAGVRVRVGGAEAPLFAVAAGNGFQQINFQVPQEAAIRLDDVSWPIGSSEARTEVEVEQNGQRGSVGVLVRKSPGDFFRLSEGSGIFQHAHDYSLVTPENPARGGEIITAYLTGMRETKPIVPSGQSSPSDPLATFPPPVPFQTDQYHMSVAVDLGATGAEILFAGLAPGLVGVNQINFKVPTGVRISTATTEVVLSRARCFIPCNSPNVAWFVSRVRMPIVPQ